MVPGTERTEGSEIIECYIITVGRDLERTQNYTPILLNFVKIEIIAKKKF